MKKLFCLFLLFFCVGQSIQAQDLETIHQTIPPSNQPIAVDSSFFLLNLISIDEKNEVFLADVYFTFAWDDHRLSFEADHPNDVKIYMDDNVLERFKTMWRPQLEFINTGQPIFSNRSLFIYPSGRVEYRLRVTADFRSEFDFAQFPFDKQVLRIEIDSFVWNKNVLHFVPVVEGKNLGAEIHNDERISNITVSTKNTTGLLLAKFGDSDQYSTLVAEITVVRKSNFFLYQIFLPLFIIMVLSCTVFFAPAGDYTDNVMISLTAFLVFLAAKFTINLDLPRVGYMTVVDTVFVGAYIAIGCSVVICTIRQLFGGPDEKSWANRLNFHSRWAVLLLFTLFVLYVFFRQY